MPRKSRSRCRERASCYAAPRPLASFCVAAAAVGIGLSLGLVSRARRRALRVSKAQVSTPSFALCEVEPSAQETRANETVWAIQVYHPWLPSVLSSLLECYPLTESQSSGKPKAEEDGRYEVADDCYGGPYYEQRVADGGAGEWTVFLSDGRRDLHSEAALGDEALHSDLTACEAQLCRSCDLHAALEPDTPVPSTSGEQTGAGMWSTAETAAPVPANPAPAAFCEVGPSLSFQSIHSWESDQLDELGPLAPSSTPPIPTLASPSSEPPQSPPPSPRQFLHAVRASEAGCPLPLSPPQSASPGVVVGEACQPPSQPSVPVADAGEAGLPPPLPAPRFFPGETGPPPPPSVPLAPGPTAREAIVALPASGSNAGEATVALPAPGPNTCEATVAPPAPGPNAGGRFHRAASMSEVYANFAAAAASAVTVTMGNPLFESSGLQQQQQQQQQQQPASLCLPQLRPASSFPAFSPTTMSSAAASDAGTAASASTRSSLSSAPSGFSSPPMDPLAHGLAHPSDGLAHPSDGLAHPSDGFAPLRARRRLLFTSSVDNPCFSVSEDEAAAASSCDEAEPTAQDGPRHHRHTHTRLASLGRLGVAQSGAFLVTTGFATAAAAAAPSEEGNAGCWDEYGEDDEGHGCGTLWFCGGDAGAGAGGGISSGTVSSGGSSHVGLEGQEGPQRRPFLDDAGDGCGCCSPAATELPGDVPSSSISAADPSSSAGLESPASVPSTPAAAPPAQAPLSPSAAAPTASAEAAGTATAVGAPSAEPWDAGLLAAAVSGAAAAAPGVRHQPAAATRPPWRSTATPSPLGAGGSPPLGSPAFSRTASQAGGSVAMGLSREASCQTAAFRSDAPPLPAFPARPPFRPASKYVKVPPPGPLPGASGATRPKTAASGRRSSSSSTATAGGGGAGLSEWLRLPSFMRPTQAYLAAAAAAAAAGLSGFRARSFSRSATAKHQQQQQGGGQPATDLAARPRWR